MDVTSRQRRYSRSSVQPEDTLTAEEQNSSSEGCVNEEHNIPTGRMITSLMCDQRRNLPHPWWLRMSHHGRSDLTQHSGDTDAFSNTTRTPIWDSSWSTEDLGKLKNIHYDQGIPQKQQSLSVAVLLPSPHIQHADAADHNNAAGPEKANRDESGWSPSVLSISMKNKFDENETIAALESPRQLSAKRIGMTTPPLPVSVRHTPSSSRLVKIPSTPHPNKEDVLE
ncbi:unnamed protein product [Clonostachys solani]|uniref:Uncharacterized protein n=1 Tax=Clonostachys solani TaxID=160281 RepID=A0A9N9ZD01_9HYPO|nr:unnamed protein product [Clonostachys solani]